MAVSMLAPRQIIFILLLPGLPLRAANWYVSQTGAGLSNGSSAGNAQTVAWLNKSGTWGTSIHPGDTVSLVGTITNGITLHGSGASATNPTTIYFTPGAMMSAPVLRGSPPTWIYTSGGGSGGSNLVIDGGVNGVIQCTENGTGSAYGGTSAFSVGDVTAIYHEPPSSAAANLTVKNLTISNLYNRLPSSSDPERGIVANDTAIYAIGGCNVLVSNCVLFNNEVAFTYAVGGSQVASNITFVNNRVTGFNHGVTVAIGASSGAPAICNVLIRRNALAEANNYESTNKTVGSRWHRDPVFVFNESRADGSPPAGDPAHYYTGVISNVIISGNLISPPANAQTTTAGTAAIFMDDYSTNQFASVQIYNNIMSLSPPLEWADGFINGAYTSGPGNLIANNTIINWHASLRDGGTYYPAGITIEAGQNYLCVNNLMYDGLPGFLVTGQPTTKYFTGLGTTNQQYFANWYSGFNILYTPKSGYQTFAQALTTGFGGRAGTQETFPSLVQWQALGRNYDNTSITDQPLLSSSCQYKHGSVGVAAGTNLSAYFATDFGGNARTNSGPWDIGAWEVQLPP
jgi:hypothetical protein